MKIGIHIFRRDLRVYDNISLYECYKEMDIVIPIFIFTPHQITKDNKYISYKSIQFMIESLFDLENQLKQLNNTKKSPIMFFYGNVIDVLNSIKERININSIYINLDYTPYSKERDLSIKSFCNKMNIKYNEYHDICLFPPKTILTDNISTYKKFTPFYNKCMENISSIQKINKNSSKINNISFIENKNIYSSFLSIKENMNLIDIYKIDKNFYPDKNKHINGGTKESLKILEKMKRFVNYDKERNDMNKQTTNLSAYLKFGCISIRQTYYSMLKISPDLVRQLIWRDFYIHLVDAYPQLLKGKSLNVKYDNIKWRNNKEWFNKWCRGETGYPIVDACMQQLNQSGYMHNRGRLIVSSFLIKILQIDWRWGEKYFANKLIDYDPSVNNGNWQWSSGSGADSQPYFRIFNPYLQSFKYDKDALYIKKWLSNVNVKINDVPAKHLHQWNKYHSLYDLTKINYYSPIVEYDKMKENTIKMYEKAVSKKK